MVIRTLPKCNQNFQSSLSVSLIFSLCLNSLLILSAMVGNLLSPVPAAAAATFFPSTRRCRQIGQCERQKLS